jgi:hypothetical protein
MSTAGLTKSAVARWHDSKSARHENLGSDGLLELGGNDQAYT